MPQVTKRNMIYMFDGVIAKSTGDNCSMKIQLTWEQGICTFGVQGRVE